MTTTAKTPKTAATKAKTTKAVKTVEVTTPEEVVTVSLGTRENGIEYNQLQFNGLTLVAPQITEEALTLGMVRKTRHMAPEEKTMELFMMILETYLEEDELAAWDKAGLGAMKMFADSQGQDLGKK